MKKIVFLDIDGTLVTPNYPLSALVKKGIKKASNPIKEEFKAKRTKNKIKR